MQDSPQMKVKSRILNKEFERFIMGPYIIAQNNIAEKPGSFIPRAQAYSKWGPIVRFPGRRKSKHYFPVSESARLDFGQDITHTKKVYVVGIDQLIVDIEAHVDDDYLSHYPVKKGESVILPDGVVEEIYQDLKKNNKIVGEFAGGAIGNTLHNYCVLSDDTSIALGTICRDIRVGDYAFKYICSTNSHVDFSYLKPCDGPMARAICFVTPDGERSFGVGKGIMNELDESFIPESLVAQSAALLISAYLLRDPSSSIYKATMKAVEVAKKNDVPVVMSLGTTNIVVEKKQEFTQFIKENVNVLAMNQSEAQALVGIEDPLLACQEILELVDLVLLTVGPKGLYMAGFVDEAHKRETKDQIHSKSISQYNQYEYSRGMLKKDCQNPIKTYTHINPYLGGPGAIRNTNGAGDAALSAILHDMAANIHHRQSVPNSPKHESTFLTYSSLHQMSKYANRASFEVLKQNSPRLTKGLPEREESLEESYWAH